jgi:hypothetical protein
VVHVVAAMLNQDFSVKCRIYLCIIYSFSILSLFSSIRLHSLTEGILVLYDSVSFFSSPNYID